jgi:hypothetical protein
MEKLTRPLCCAATVLAATWSMAATAGDAFAAVAPARPIFELVGGHDGPVLRQGDPGTEDNKYGFEGGCVLKRDGLYHLFTAERSGDPLFVKTRLAHWQSRDGLKWQRQATLWESSAEFTGRDPRASLWAPMPFYNDKENRWNIFYVAYRAKPNTDEGWFANYDGRIYRAASKTAGPEGLAGPYADIGVVMESGPDCGPWEGLQGTDSFYAYQAKDRWYAFFGSAQTQKTLNPKYPKWTVGLATAPDLAGPWKRCNERNPVVMNREFVENPIVTRLKDGLFVAMLDGGHVDARMEISYSVSDDGLSWSEASFIDLTKKSRRWWTNMRTPLCLIPEENGLFTVFYTAHTESGFACLGQATLRRITK